MLKFKLMIACAAAVLVSAGYAEEKSAWKKFVEFFSPSSEVEGEGPLYDQIRELDRKINRVEGKYARERRPMTKDRYKKELIQLREEREALMKKIEAEEKSKGKSSATQSSSAVVKSSSSVKAAVSSSSSVASSASVAVTVESCKPDTVYVRDTVVVHDTLYVMLAPKPESADTSKK